MNVANQQLVKPLETFLQLPIHLDGSNGSNRNVESFINANCDFEALRVWLRRYDNSPQTFRSYRKEIERLFLWSINYLNKPFSSLDVEDIQDYLKFIKNPNPKEVWCGPRRPRSDSRWRPFEKPLNQNSQKQVLTIMGTCFSFLVEAGYLNSNPIKLLSKSSRPKSQSVVIERYLDKDIWQLFWQHLLLTKITDKQQQNHFERTLFIFSLLYLQSPRASEVVNHSMSSIIQVHSKWWWQITGKGQKTKLIPWKDKTMDALKRYRIHRGLSPLPSKNDYAPLVASLTGENYITADMLYKIVKKTVKEIANEISTQHPAKAEKLMQASTHWFRHTSLTHQADDGVNLRHLQAMARHESLETTQRYFHIESDEFHDALNK